mmetsp:Transcript_139565/g.446605  ORF Transcript_139565/g.446605 Transcript_139565/m.446605 type:complete len:321 (-) Transcript_139565:402-1364(-)
MHFLLLRQLPLQERVALKEEKPILRREHHVQGADPPHATLGMEPVVHVHHHNVVEFVRHVSVRADSEQPHVFEQVHLTGAVGVCKKPEPRELVALDAGLELHDDSLERLLGEHAAPGMASKDGTVGVVAHLHGRRAPAEDVACPAVVEVGQGRGVEAHFPQPSHRGMRRARILAEPRHILLKPLDAILALLQSLLQLCLVPRQQPHLGLEVRDLLCQPAAGSRHSEAPEQGRRGSALREVVCVLLEALQEDLGPSLGSERQHRWPIRSRWGRGARPLSADSLWTSRRRPHRRAFARGSRGAHSGRARRERVSAGVALRVA